MDHLQQEVHKVRWINKKILADISKDELACQMEMEKIDAERNEWVLPLS